MTRIQRYDLKVRAVPMMPGRRHDEVVPADVLRAQGPDPRRDLQQRDEGQEGKEPQGGKVCLLLDHHSVDLADIDVIYLLYTQSVHGCSAQAEQLATNNE